MSRNNFRYSAVILGGVATALAFAAGCSANPATTPAAPAPTTLTPSIAPTAVSQAQVAGAGSTHAAPAPHVAAAQPERKFPNTNDDVVFTAYDQQRKMAVFQLVVQDPHSPSARLIVDPKDPAKHELPVSRAASIRSIDPNGFPFETCPPTSCTPDLIISSVIGHNNNEFYAHIHVNGADQIDDVAQSAY